MARTKKDPPDMGLILRAIANKRSNPPHGKDRPLGPPEATLQSIRFITQTLKAYDTSSSHSIRQSSRKRVFDATELDRRPAKEQKGGDNSEVCKHLLDVIQEYTGPGSPIPLTAPANNLQKPAPKRRLLAYRSSQPSFRANRAKEQVGVETVSSDGDMEIAESDHEESRQQEEKFSTGLGNGSPTVSKTVNHGKKDDKPQSKQIKLVNQSLLETSTKQMSPRGQQASLHVGKMRPKRESANNAQTRQDREDKATKVDEGHKPAIIKFMVEILQPKLNSTVHHIESHHLHNLNSVGELDISGYLGKYGGHSRKVFRRADILDVLYQKKPPLAAPALIVGIYVGGGLKDPSIHFLWLWELEYLTTEKKVEIQERIKTGEKWVIDGDLQVMTPECIDKPAEVKKHTVAKGWYFDTTAKDPGMALRPITELEERLRIPLLEM